MDVTPQLFDECTNHYRQARQKYAIFTFFAGEMDKKNIEPACLMFVVCLCLVIATALTLFHLLLFIFVLCSDRKRLQDREELWLRLEQQAADNRFHPCRSPPSIPSRLHSVNISKAYLSNARIFSTLLLVGYSRVFLSYYVGLLSIVAFEQGEGLDMTMDKDDKDVDGSATVGGVDQDMYSGDLQTFENSGPVFHQFRRKSIIPVDETVLTELSRHRSLDEVLNEPPSPSTSSTFAHHHIIAPGTGVGNASSQPVLPGSGSSSGVNHVQET
jgi:serine/threonine-protein phosphatase 2A regulatory subunit B'